MQFYPSFNFNYPIKIKALKWFPNQSKEIIKRSKRVLKKRNEKQITFAFLTINWIREAKNRDLYIKEIKKGINKEKTFISDFGNIDRINQPTSTKMLFDNIKDWNILGQPDFPKATYSEYFAVLALSLISELLNDFNFNDSKSIKNKKDRDLINLTIAGCIVMDALEAISFAEYYSWDLEDKVKKELSMRNQRAAILRHEEDNEIKNEIKSGFKTFYKENQHLKKAAAARKFYKTIPKEKQILSDSYYVTYLVSSLSEGQKK